MRSCSTALSDFLDDRTNQQALIIDLYTFFLTDGSYLRYCEWTSNLSFQASAFPALSGGHNAGGATTFLVGPRFTRSKVTTKIGIEPTELDLTIVAGAADTIGNFTWAQAARLGVFDGAEVELDRLFSPPQQPGIGDRVDTSSLGCLIWFLGRVSEVDIGRSHIQMKVKSLIDLLQTHQFPRRLFGSPCTHIFGGTMCGYDRVNGLNALGGSTGLGQATITCTAGSTQAAVQFGVTIDLAYVEGTVTGLTGANAGIMRTIAGVVGGGEITLFKPFLYTVTAGDQFNILPGCHHTVSACQDSFNNLDRYGGFPHIPPPESAIGIFLAVSTALSTLLGLVC